MEKKEFLKLITAVSKAYRTKIDEGTMIVYYDFLKDMDGNIVKEAFKKIIEKNKYFPSVAEIKEECNNLSQNKKYEILEKMKNDGYFKDNEYSISEYEKAHKWLETGIIPEWFKEDMKNYDKQKATKIEYKEKELINIYE